MASRPLKKHVNAQTTVTFFQKVYLSVIFFLSNDMFSYASACAFGFLFSFIPVAMMIFVILIRFLHTKPETISALFGENTALLSFFNLEYVAHTVQQITSVTNFEIVLGIAIILMARRFFSSVISGLNKIFRQLLKPRPLVSQLFILLIEASLIIIISAAIFFIITVHSIAALPITLSIEARHPALFSDFSQKMTGLFPFVIIFIAVSVSYRMGIRSHIRFRNCVLASAFCTLVFKIFQKIMHIFINVNNYNFVYGVLSNAIVLLMEVFFFFVIFLFFAQVLFVSQFFDTLLLSEIYLLPEYEDTGLVDTVKRLLFIRPDALLKQEANVMVFKKGCSIYCKNDTGSCTYYLVHGMVQLNHINNVAYVNRGSFFGEEAVMLNGVRTEDAIAYTDCKVVKIPEASFFSVLEKNPKVSMKALAKISKYFAKFYGRNGEFVL